jgi:hypothetical protein
MSFNEFNFKFTPPKTVQPAPQEVTPGVGSSGVATPSSTSRSGKLASKLDDLIETSAYLQDAIVQRLRTVGVVVDFNSNPDVVRALSAIYGSNPPGTISVSMLDSLLNADIGVMQTEMALGPSSPLEVNIFQAADLQLVTRFVEKQLIDSGTFNNQLPTLLRTLKGDAVIFQAWKSQLASYPAFSTVNKQALLTNPLYVPGKIKAIDVDLQVKTFEYMDDLLNRFGNVYSRVYRTLSEVNSVERTINSVALEYFYQPLDNIVRILSMMQTLRGIVHKPRLQDISDDLLNFAFTRLTAEVTESLFTIDQLIQMAVAPFQSTIGSLGRMIAGVQGLASDAASTVKGIGKLLSGGLKGMVSSNTCSGSKGPIGTPQTASKDLQIPGLANVSAGLYTLAAHLDWSKREANRHLQLIDLQFKRLAERRITGHSDRLDILCSLQSMDSLTNLATSVLQEKKAGTVTAADASQPAPEVMNRILTNLQTGTSTTFIINGSDVIANPPDMPVPSSKVQDLFARSGIEKVITE